jgi:hypothetical protein
VTFVFGAAVNIAPSPSAKAASTEGQQVACFWVG